MGAKNTGAIVLIGAGRMGAALLKGWAAAGVAPLVAVEPKPGKELRALACAAGAHLVTRLADAPAVASACVVAIKPQILKTAAPDLRPLAEGGALMLSIAAGTSVAFLKATWGPKARIVRAMPNTPGAIGRGITGLYAAPGTRVADRKLADMLLAALGQTVWLDSEAAIDAVTAVSGSGPAYVFYLVEALAAAGVRAGLEPAVAMKLARATVAGSGALLDADVAGADALRVAVTSPGGTTEAALKVLMARDGLVSLMTRAVAAAKKRARELR